MGQDIVFSFSFTGSKTDLLDSLENARKYLLDLVPGIFVYPLHHGTVPKGMTIDKLRRSETSEHRFTDDEYEVLLRATVDEEFQNMIEIPSNMTKEEKQRLIEEKRKTEYKIKEFAGFAVHPNSDEKRQMLVVILHRPAGTNRWRGKCSIRPSRSRYFNKTWNNIARILAVVASIIRTRLDMDDYGGLENDIRQACVELKRNKCI